MHEFVGLSDVSVTVAVRTQVCVCVCVSGRALCRDFCSVCVRTRLCGWWVVLWSPFRHKWAFVSLPCSPSEAMFPPPEHSCRTLNFAPAVPTKAEPSPPLGALSLTGQRMAVGVWSPGLMCVWDAEPLEGGEAPPLLQRLPGFKSWLSHFPAL